MTPVVRWDRVAVFLCGVECDYAHTPAGVKRPARLSLGVSHLGVTADVGLVGTVCGMSYSSDLTDEQWALLKPVFNAPGKRGPRHAPDLRSVVDAMLYISHTGCQWRFLPESFGPWTRVWSQFRRPVRRWRGL
jgi:hypothetical protein